MLICKNISLGIKYIDFNFLNYPVNCTVSIVVPYLTLLIN